MTDQPTTGAETPAQPPAPVEAAVAPDHVLTLQTEVIAGGASTRWEATGEAWSLPMAVAGLASLMLTIEELSAAFAETLKAPQAVVLQKVGEKVRAAKEAQAAAAAPKVVLAPPGFNANRLRLARDDDGPRRHPPGI